MSSMSLKSATLRGILCALLALLLTAGDVSAWQTPASNDADSDRTMWEKLRDMGTDKEIEVETRSPGRDVFGTRPIFRGHLQIISSL